MFTITQYSVSVVIDTSGLLRDLKVCFTVISVRRMEKFKQDNDFSENYKQDSSLVELSQSKICEEGVLQSNSTVYLENVNQPETKTDTLISNQEELEVVQPLKSKDTFRGGLLLVWGCGEFGQHGHGHTEDVLSGDALVSPLWLGQERMVVEVACGSSHTLVLTGQ